MEPWTRPILDVFREFYAVKEIEHMLAEQIIEIAPLAFCRGRTFKNSYVILDESQNTSKSQVLMILTRIGFNSKIVLTGDTDQTDHKRGDNGLIDLCGRLQRTGVEGIQICEFDDRDVQRHRLIKEILKLYSHD
jgi:phosphate starvation-inducible PhoH-like protein